MAIHPTAVVHPEASVAENVEIGAYAVVGSRVSLAAGVRVDAHVVIAGPTTIGAGTRIFSFASVGSDPQDLKYDGEVTALEIGANNLIREGVTISRGTVKGGGVTRIGDNNILMANSHVAHDCVVGSHMVMSSHAAFGGHVVAGDHVNVGWGVGVHQFCRLGNHAMISACSKVVQDVLPFMLVDGVPAEHRSVNKVGLERNGFSSGEIEQTRSLFKILFKEGLNKSQALERLQGLEIQEGDRILPTVLDFAGGATDRGLA